MFLLYILGSFLLLLTVASLLPVSVKLSYDDEFKYKVKIAFITLDFEKEKPKKQKKSNKPKEKTVKNTKKNFFEKLKDKKGFVGAVKEIFSFVKDCVEPLKKFLRFVQFSDIRLFVAVVGDDAAQTAIDYGIICSAVYPTLSFVEGFANLQYKSVDIKADFENKKSDFKISLKIKTSIIFILILLIRVLKEYKNLTVRNELE